MKARQMMMINNMYLDEPRMFNNGLPCIHTVDVGVYFGILWFRICYESISLTCESLLLYKILKHFEYKTGKSSLALMQIKCFY